MLLEGIVNLHSCTKTLSRDAKYAVSGTNCRTVGQVVWPSHWLASSEPPILLLVEKVWWHTLPPCEPVESNQCGGRNPVAHLRLVTHTLGDTWRRNWSMGTPQTTQRYCSLSSSEDHPMDCIQIRNGTVDPTLNKPSRYLYQKSQVIFHQI